MTVPAALTEAQRRVLDAAVDAFAERGFGGTGTRDIANRAGRSPAAIYVHYPSKEDLLFAVSELGHRDALQALEGAFAAYSEPVRRLWAMVHAFSEWHMTHAKLGRVVQYEFRALSEDHRKVIVALRRRFHQLMSQTLEEGVRTGAFDVLDLQGTARALLSLGIDLVRWYDPELQRDPDTVARSNADLALRMVRAS